MNYNYYQPYQFNNVPSQVQRLQKMRDDITEQLAQMQQQPVPQIQQTFITPQATPNYMDIPAKWVDKYEDVQNAQVYVATLFMDRNSSKFYIKDETGAVKSFEFQEIEILDEKDLKIRELENQIRELKEGGNNYGQSINEPNGEHIKQQQIRQPVATNVNEPTSKK